MNVVTFLISKHFKVYNLYYIQPFFSSMLYFELYKVYDKKKKKTFYSWMSNIKVFQIDIWHMSAL